jgi:hypothetical protein
MLDDLRNALLLLEQAEKELYRHNRTGKVKSDAERPVSWAIQAIQTAKKHVLSELESAEKEALAKLKASCG